MWNSTRVRPRTNPLVYGVLKLDFPTNVVTIGFADIIGLPVVLRRLDEVEIYVSETVYNVKFWLAIAGISLTERNTEAVLITERRKSTTMKIKVGTQIIHS